MTVYAKEKEMNEDLPIFKFAVREDLIDTGNLFLPTRGEGKASGWDVRAAQKDRKPLLIKAGEHIRIPLGIRAFCPDGWYYRLMPRSSTFAKKHLHCLYGVIDETYENELILAAQFIPDMQFADEFAANTNLSVAHNNKTLTINFGDAIGQIIPVRRQEMIIESINNEEYNRLCVDRNGERGEGGFGSTSR
jgi:dUTPase